MQRSGDYRPEVDHIIPAAQEGANDTRNARILSRNENTAPGTSKPAPKRKKNAQYTRPITIQGRGRNAGDSLTLADLTDLIRFHTGFYVPFPTWAAVTALHVGTIRAIANPGPAPVIANGVIIFVTINTGAVHRNSITHNNFQGAGQ